MDEENVVVKDDFFDDLLADFLDETGQLLARLNDNLLELDEWMSELSDEDSAQVDQDLINEMFRSAHSIKGLSGMLGLNHINSLTHKIENVFDATRKGELLINQVVVDLMFQGADRLEEMIEKLRQKQNDDVECGELLESIAKLLQESGTERNATSQEDAEKALESLMNVNTENVVVNEISTNLEAEEPGILCTNDVADHFFEIVDEEVPAKYLSIFIDECELTLDSLSDRLLSSDGCSSSDAVDDLLINSHRIKGSAASIGLNRAAKLAHFMEDILQELRDSDTQLTDSMVESMLQATDAIRNFVEGLKNGTPNSENFNLLACNLIAAKDDAHSNEEVKQEELGARNTLIEDSVPSDASKTNDEASDTATEQAMSNDPPAENSQTCEAIEEIRQLGSSILDSYCAVVSFPKELPLVGIKAQLVFEKLSRSADIFFCQPEPELLESLEELEHLYLGFSSNLALSELTSLLKVSGVQSLDLTMLDERESENTSVEIKNADAEKAETEKTVAKQAKAPEVVVKPSDTKEKQKTTTVESKSRSATKPTETLRVEIDRLDQLMNLAGQLVINKARFTRISEGLNNSSLNKQTPTILSNVHSLSNKILSTIEQASDATNTQTVLESIRSQVKRLEQDVTTVMHDINRVSETSCSVNDFSEAVHQLDRVSDGIQKSVMETRMVPIGPLFTRFKRVIRDISRANKKDIRLEIRGEKTKLDKRMIDELGDPLIHMVRNSADHGIESPEDRIKVGKPRQGVVTLDAFHRGNNIYIIINDDGKGLSIEKIKEKALEKGIASEADLERMTSHQIYQLVWEPGFSTAEKVTEISGRGMGMDIVRSKIEDINGTIELSSIVGQGATFTIKLPLTLAILPSLLANIDNEVFALPVESVIEIVNLQPEDFSSVQQVKTATIRGRIVSAIDLNEVFDWSSSPISEEQNQCESTDSILVIIGSEGKEIGLRVDSLLGEEDIVIKSMAENYKNVPGIAGASILGDGRVSLILDPSAIIDMSSGKELSLTQA